MLKYLNGNKVPRAKIPTKDVLKRQTTFSSTIFQQNAHFNMYIETSKQQQGSPFKILTQNVLKRQILTDSIAHI